MKGEIMILHGCTPTPFASYLKALGMLRLISSPANHVSGEAADPQARGWWENEYFHLKTTMTHDTLLRFFLYDYAPSPIIAPWNGRAGFLEGEDSETSTRGGAILMRGIENSECQRLKSMRDTIRLLRRNKRLVEFNNLRAQVKRLKEASKHLAGDEKKRNDDEKSRKEKEAQAVKSLVLPSIRSETDLHHVAYIDACYVLSSDEAAAPLLGSGGNDGSRDFGVNFAEELQTVLDFENGDPTECGEAELSPALFDTVQRTENRGSMGQFSPGQGGPNATTGYTGDNPLNSWDVILTLEGTLIFAGALTRRWGTNADNRGAFPFTFQATGAGAGALSSEDPNRPRGEIWTPIWTKPATHSEIATVFAEGRLTLEQRSAKTGLDAARSITRVGHSRGITGFERYSIIQPDSKMPYQATPLGRYNTPDRPRKDLVGDLEKTDWLGNARRLVGNKNTMPARARHAMRRLDDALFLMTTENRGTEGAQNALVALGSLTTWLTTNSNAREEMKPPPPVSSGWTQEANDGSAEFRIAAALAGLGLPARHVETSHIIDSGGSQPVTPNNIRKGVAPPMAAHLAPLDEEQFFYRNRISTRRRWKDGDTPPTVVWGAGSLISNMIAVLERRLVETGIRGLEDKPLASATSARLADVGAFLSGDFDDIRCAALLAGLVWARPTNLKSTHRYKDEHSLSVPLAYAVLKPVFTPDNTLHTVGVLPETTQMPIPPGLIARLRAGGNGRDGQATNFAVRLALARARASGLPTLFDSTRSDSRASSNGGNRIGAGIAADRLAAALLVPISDKALITLVKRAYPGVLSENDNSTTEDITHAA